MVAWSTDGASRHNSGTSSGSSCSSSTSRSAPTSALLADTFAQETDEVGLEARIGERVDEYVAAVIEAQEDVVQQQRIGQKLGIMSARVLDQYERWRRGRGRRMDELVAGGAVNTCC